MRGFLAEVLSLPHNRAYVTAVKTARSWGVPPRVMVFGGSPGEWSAEDALLANALTVLENETCNRCGTPVWWGYSTDNEIQFKIGHETCHACVELEKRQSEDSKNKTARRGQSPYVTPHNVWEGKPLPSRREFFERRK